MPEALNRAESSGRERVIADAAARGIPIEIVPRSDAVSLDEAAAVLGISPAEIVKSLVVKRHDGSFLFALVRGDRQISWRKLRAVVGVNKLHLSSAELALKATGYERGTITPLGSSTAWPVFVDSRIAEPPGPGSRSVGPQDPSSRVAEPPDPQSLPAGRRIAMGAGTHGFSLFVDAHAFIVGLNATVADISD